MQTLLQSITALVVLLSSLFSPAHPVLVGGALPAYIASPNTYTTVAGTTYSKIAYSALKLTIATKVDAMSITPLSFADRDQWIDAVNNEIRNCGGLNLKNYNSKTTDIVKVENDMLKNGCPQ